MFKLPFTEIIRARYVERPNRFLVTCDVPGAGVVDAFLPNPGRLWELLLPDVTVYLAPAADNCGERKTKFTMVAVERDDVPVFLDTHTTNLVARHLIEERLVPSLEDARIVRAEATVGRSRFDFLMKDGQGEFYLEVKSCTLFGNGVAMFPDAVTARGRRHLIELAEMGKGGMRPVVLFVVHCPTVRWFMPDYHTDLAFSRTFLDVRRHVRILPVAVEWRDGLALGRQTRLVDIPWDYLDGEVRDTGAYLLVMRFGEKKRIEVGKLGPVVFDKGYYVYVGSAMRNLGARIARHLRRRKRLRWHVDYLREHADEVTALPIRSSRRRECEIARAMAGVFRPYPTGFGSSDCACACHLFYSETAPLESHAFHVVLQQFRMSAPSRC